MVDDEVIDFAVANHLVNVLEELGEEINLLKEVSNPPLKATTTFFFSSMVLIFIS